MSLLLPLNKFHAFFWCFYCWLWTKKCRPRFITNVVCKLVIYKISKIIKKQTLLTLSWRRALSYRNQSIDLQSKLIDWFLYNNGLCHERVNRHCNVFIKSSAKSNRLLHTNISIHVSHWFLAWIASPFFLINGMSVSCPSRFSQLIRIGKNLKASLFKILKC